MRGTRYRLKSGFNSLPASNSTASRSAVPMPMMMEPSTWLRTPSGLTIIPQSNPATTLCTLTPLLCTTSSTHSAT